ncbi:hypothetical protein PsorP6_016208 [Peronosclerospora sorghi]|uniref:Uncharacterized protein n=1 Tax=Peronosclerospora sorghi TaxID=230839 RepID=A0ACC0VLB5_9STRA|nr:hypothetical protein PsorP6_016208 [Peronosclerospora sorghi]
MSHMRVFGSRGFVYVDSSKRSKFDPKAHRCIFLRYAENSKAYRVYDIDDQRVVVSRTIALDESPPSKYVPVPISQSLQYTWSTLDDDFDRKHTPKVKSNQDDQDQVMQSPPLTPSSNQSRPMDISPDDAPTIAADNQRMLPPPLNDSQDNNDTRFHDRALVRTEQRGENRNMFGGHIVPWSNDITMTGDGVEDNDDSEEPDPKRLRITDGYDIALTVMDVPRTYNEAMASPQAYNWKEAIQSALQSRNPNVFGQRLEEMKDGDVVDMKRYRELIGTMLYIANGTRPDICVSICELSQHLEAPKPAHMKAAIRVLRYLAGTSKFGLCYSRNDTTMINPVVYVDANWGGDVNTRRSRSGVLILLCGAAVIYKSKRQRSVALSSAEAEYVALSIAAQEVLRLRHLLTELSVGSLSSTMVY